MLIYIHMYVRVCVCVWEEGEIISYENTSSLCNEVNELYNKHEYQD